MATRYDYSSLKVNGVTPTQVIVNGTQIYRLIANGVDIIHKYSDQSLKFTLTPSCRIGAYISYSCGGDESETSCDNMKLKVSWTSSKSIQKIDLTAGVSITLSVTKTVSCGDDVTHQAVVSDDATVTLTSSGSTITYSESKSIGGIFFNGEFSVAINAKVYFTDGSGADFSFTVSSSQFSLAKNSTRTYSQNITKSISTEMKEY